MKKSSVLIFALCVLSLAVLSSCDKEPKGPGGPRYAPAPECALPKVFSLGPDFQVYFTKGNLQAKIDAKGMVESWKFADKQYECIGDGGANKTIGTAEGYVDLFAWSTGMTTFGISTSEIYSDFGGDFIDWADGYDPARQGFFTPSIKDWKYLLSGAPEGRGEGDTFFKVNVTVCGQAACTVVAPDGNKTPILESYDEETWAKAEEEGFMCLPAAGYRIKNRVSNLGTYGYCWSSTPDSEDPDKAWFLYFTTHGSVYFQSSFRTGGHSVRLALVPPAISDPTLK